MYVTKVNNYGRNKRKGQPKKLSIYNKRRIARKASNSTISAAKIWNKLNSNVLRETVPKAIHCNPHLVRGKIIKIPKLKEEHK